MKQLRNTPHTPFELYHLKTEEQRDCESWGHPPSPSLKAWPRPHLSSRAPILPPSRPIPFPYDIIGTSVVPTRRCGHRQATKLAEHRPSGFNFLPAPFQKCSVPHSSLATLYPVAVWANLSIPTIQQQILTGRKQPFN